MRKNKVGTPNNLLFYRKQSGLSKKEAALKLGLKNTTTLDEWEKGITYPDINHLLKLCAMYQVKSNQLYGVLIKKLRGEIKARMKLMEQKKDTQKN